MRTTTASFAAVIGLGLATLTVSAAPKPCKPPVLSLTAPTSGTVGQAVPFTASVQPASGNCPVTSWYLSFGDGDVLNGQSATTLTTSHVYTLASEWTAELGAQAVTGPPAAPKQVRIAVSDTPPPPPPPPSGRGPQASIVCPAGAVNVSPGASIQGAVNANVGTTTFCLRAGVHPVTSSVTPKSGNTFVGEFGAILDGGGWNSSNLDDAVFISVNNGVSNVTIRNLVLRDGPSYGVNAYLTAATWTVEYNDIIGFRNGVSTGRNSLIHKNRILDNKGIFNDPNPALRGGGIVLNCAEGTQILDNEIARNGQEQKIIVGTHNELSRNYTIAGNFVHHNVGDGIWFDGDGAGSIVENNTVEDNGGPGIVLEATDSVTVRNNFVRRNAEEGILLTVAKNNTVTGNTLEGNVFGIGLFLDFNSLPPNSPPLPWGVQDLANNAISGNTVRIPVGGYGAMFIVVGPGDPAPYTSNAKNNVWSNNTYVAPTTTGAWFMWANVNRPFAQWQAVPQDAGSSLTVQ